MIKTKINKKGISPLIATVLLIGFTVALAGVVITWGGGFVDRITAGTEDRTAQTLACTTDLRFEIKNVKCPDTLTVENKGSIKIEKLRLRYFDANGDLKTGGDTEGESVDKFEVKAITLDPKIPAGTTKVESIATIIVDEQEVTCGDAIRSKSFTTAC